MAEPPKRRGPVLIEMDAAPATPAPGGPETTPQGAQSTAEPDRRSRRAPRSAPRDGEDAPSPADAPMIDDGLSPAMPQPRTMQLVARIAGAGPSPLTRFFLNTGAALLTFLLSVATLRFLSDLLRTYPLLGWIGIFLMVLFCLAALAMGWREYRAWSRFAAIDGINRAAGAALASGDVAAAQDVVGRLERLYRARPELEWGRERLARHKAEAYEAQTLIAMAETELLAPLDQQARREIEAASRTVAAATALIPLALADVVAALAANMRMIRRMAEIYGGRAGAVGGWRLARTVMTHLVATGAVAAGDDLIHTVAGGGILARVSKRFGEGVVNGALTARVGIAAMEVCRPLPFIQQPRPKVGNLIARGLKGLFGEDQEAK
ncbi:TIGR01620 family protein [Paracoccus sp. CPCC 101403]|uniref:TIGR01620 family protein n=1 Tax=Paracoccus broussonetiae TaxID=3075834 RepID=A0ABU3E8S7_9RHOB|nr:TIGR01620 family protein [Paracoccus sp. CPCC 101403]MDT1060561.1 TIGR01620 family protein [Paracoccus sp. CPCC 101403]